MNTQEQKLKLAPAKMLPEKIELEHGIPHWKELRSPNISCPILDTEWLHVCWLVEETLDQHEQNIYGGYVFDNYGIHASWQQRAEALCKVKGVEI